MALQALDFSFTDRYMLVERLGTHYTRRLMLKAAGTNLVLNLVLGLILKLGTESGINSGTSSGTDMIPVCSNLRRERSSSGWPC